MEPAVKKIKLAVSFILVTYSQLCLWGKEWLLYRLSLFNYSQSDYLYIVCERVKVGHGSNEGYL